MIAGPARVDNQINEYLAKAKWDKATPCILEFENYSGIDLLIFEKKDLSTDRLAAHDRNRSLNLISQTTALHSIHPLRYVSSMIGLGL